MLENECTLTSVCTVCYKFHKSTPILRQMASPKLKEGQVPNEHGLWLLYIFLCPRVFEE